MALIIEGGINIGGGIHMGNAPVSSDIIASGLQLYVDAALSSSYPGTGTTWFDLSGNGNDVEMQNIGGIAYTSSGGGYFTLTSNGYFNNTSTSNLPVGSSPYTMSAWVQWGSSWPGAGGIMSIGNAWGSGESVNAFRSNGNNLVNYWWANDFEYTPSPFPGDSWINVVCYWDGTTRGFYVNGVAQGSQAASGLNVTDGTFEIGSTNNYGEPLNGKIGQALVYNRALSEAEIQQNYYAIASRYSL